MVCAGRRKVCARESSVGAGLGQCLVVLGACGPRSQSTVGVGAGGEWTLESS